MKAQYRNCSNDKIKLKKFAKLQSGLVMFGHGINLTVSYKDNSNKMLILV